MSRNRFLANAALRNRNRSHRAAKSKVEKRAYRVQLEPLEKREMLTGTWTPVTNLATLEDTLGKMTLLSDGSVLAPKVGDGVTRTSEKLTPDASGSYVNGAWSALAPFTASRGNASELTLPDGRVLVLAGATNPSTGEIYNPLTNVWSSIAPLPESVYDAPTMLLPNGKVLVGSIVGPQTYIYDPAADSWSSGPAKIYGDSSDHESWTELPGGGILSYDVNASPGEAQRLDPTTMTWVDAGTVPVPLEAGVSAFEGMGPGVLLPDGRVFQLGRSSQTAIYTPPTAGDGTNGVGSWAAGPVIPNGLEAGGSGQYSGLSAAMLPNGHVLFTVDMPDAGGPTRFYEFDPNAPLANSLTDVTPSLTQFQNMSEAYQTSLLVLPSGQVMLGINNGAAGGMGNQAFIYTPDGAPQAAWKPTISSVVASGNHYTLTGTQLNGISAGASHGANDFGSTNFPIVELKNTAGKVFFARTSNWSSTGVATGSTPETTQFTLPAGLQLAQYSLTVVANGISSAPFSFTGGFVGADLAVTLTNAGPATAEEGDWLNYNLSVTNIGPSATTKTVLTDTLGPNLAFAFAISPQGSIKQSGSVITFSLGTIAAGQTVQGISVIGQALKDGNLINSVSVTSNVSDANLLNNTASLSLPVTDPPIVVSAPITVTGKNQSNITTATFVHWTTLEPDAEPTSDFVATINWGDGTTSAGTVTYTSSSGTYKVKGSHTYAKNGSYTVSTTVVEAGSGGAMAAHALVSNGLSVSTNTTANPPATAKVQPAAAASNPPRLKPAVVDQVFTVAPVNRIGSALHASSNSVTEDALEKFFDLG